MRFAILPLMLVVLPLFGCGSSSSELRMPHEDLDATLWLQTSAEYVAAAEQVYRAARNQLEMARTDPKWSAVASQQQRLNTLPSDANPLPPAVILDVDETVLDNSGYQARLIRDNEQYNPENWAAWTAEAQSWAVPGVKTFVDVCRESGVRVFFVTNRDARSERDTRRNLEELGLLSADAEDTILSKNERDYWTTDKSSRREFITKRHRVLLLIGDDLNDFVWAGLVPTSSARRQLAVKHADLWGEKWFILPNPNYGGWERSLFEFKDELERHEKIERKGARCGSPSHWFPVVSRLPASVGVLHIFAGDLANYQKSPNFPVRWLTRHVGRVPFWCTPPI